MLSIAFIRQLFNRLAELQRRNHTRKQLLGLDNHLLNDIGVSHEQAYREAQKPFWRS